MALQEKNLVDLEYSNTPTPPAPQPTPSGSFGGAKDFELFHVYSKDTLVFYDNHLYRANYDFKSGENFDITDWEVAPFAGAWIETPPRQRLRLCPVVAPFAGAWIETHGKSKHLQAEYGRALRGRVD